MAPQIAHKYLFPLNTQVRVLRISGENVLIDPFPVDALYDLYGINKTALYDRFNFLGIKPHRIKEQGNATFVTLDEKALLDEVDRGIKKGKRIKDIVGTMQVEPKSEFALAPPEKADHSADLIEMVTAIARAIRPQDPLQNLRLLKEASDNEYILSTAQLRELLGVRQPKAGDRQGFRITPVKKNNRTIGWKVEQLK